MSNQVVFTKEEVARIRESLAYFAAVSEESGFTMDLDEAHVALSILDSSRPRPKIKRQLLNDVYNTAIDYVCGSIDNPSATITNRAHAFGFDVED